MRGSLSADADVFGIELSVVLPYLTLNPLTLGLNGILALFK